MLKKVICIIIIAVLVIVNGVLFVLFNNNSDEKIQGIGIVLNTDEYIFNKIDETLQLNAIVLSGKASGEKLIWSSDDSSVAEVDKNGLVTPVSNGIAIISVSLQESNYTANCVVTVNFINEEPIITEANRLEIVNKVMSITEGKSLQLIVNVISNSADKIEITFVSSDETIVKVDQKGLLTGIKSGKATISVFNSTKEYYDEFEIEVTRAIAENVSVTLPKIPNPQLDASGYLISDNLDKFYSQNSDCVAWIHIPGTRINCPVGYYNDEKNWDYYLNHTLDKKSSSSGGSAFFSYWNDSIKNFGVVAEANTVIFGHAKSAVVFSDLKNVTKTDDWFNVKSNRFVMLNTLKYETVWEIFACFYTDSVKNYYLEPYYFLKENERTKISNNFNSEEKQKYVSDIAFRYEAMRDKTAFFSFFNNWRDRVALDISALNEYVDLKNRDYGVVLKDTDKILTLSTCAEVGIPDNYRYIVLARLVKTRPRTRVSE